MPNFIYLVHVPYREDGVTQYKDRAFSDQREAEAIASAYGIPPIQIQKIEVENYERY